MDASCKDSAMDEQLEFKIIVRNPAEERYHKMQTVRVVKLACSQCKMLEGVARDV